MKVKIGHVSVDSGAIFVGDPCYTITSDASHHIKTWSEFCEKSPFGKKDYDVTEPAGPGIGLVVPTMYGDGTYPVYATIKDGRIASVTIDFDGSEEDE
jgi:hypothetical protein